MFKLFSCSLLLTGALLGSGFVGAPTWQQRRVHAEFQNPSFEDPNPRASASPDGWSSRTRGSTPDIMPGAWGLKCQPHHGKTCLGLVTRNDGTVEDVGQALVTPLQQGQCYQFSIWLAHAEHYVGYNQAIRLRIWGGNGPGQKQVLLDASPLIDHSEWREQKFQFTPSQQVSYLTFEAYFAPGVSFKYKGNILLDQCSAIEICEKA